MPTNEPLTRITTKLLPAVVATSKTRGWRDGNIVGCASPHVEKTDMELCGKRLTKYKEAK